MPKINSDINDIAGRIISLSAIFTTNREFLQVCGISNHSLITDLKKGRIKHPGADILAQIVRGTGCNGTWLLTGEGEMFEPHQIPPIENGIGSAMIRGAQTLIEEIEQKVDEGVKIDLPDDIELQLARLLTKILERQKGKNFSKGSKKS